MTATTRGMRRASPSGWNVALPQAVKKGISIGLEQGLERGLERGAYQTKLETARSFLAYGDAPEKVALCTGLPIETVMGLRQET